MKDNLRIIGYATCVIFILLWLNQLFAGINLYKMEKSQWQKHMDSLVETRVDNYLRFAHLSNESDHVKEINFDTRAFVVKIQTNDTVYSIPVDSNETRQSIYMQGLFETLNPDTSPFSKLDSFLRLPSHDQETNIRFVSRKTDSLGIEIERYPQNDTDISRMIRSRVYPVGFLSGESIEIYYNFPIIVFIEKAWNDIIAIIAFTLMLLLGLLYLSRMQQQLSRLQEKMIKQVLHDWKTPLNNIETLAQLLEKKSISPDDEKGIKKIHFIQQEAELLKTGSQQLLQTLSGIAHLRIDRCEFNLRTELSALLEKLQNANLNQKNIHLQLRYLVESTNIHASRFHLLGAIQNLLENAVKYAGEEPQISIICYQKRGTLIIQVKDNGPGIPKKEQKHIFNKYYQINKNDNSGVKKGYGLGLTYVRNVIKAHRGTISLDSSPGKGCTFIIRLRKWKKK